MSVSVKVDLSRAMRKINIAREQLPFATALALTKTAQAAKSDLQDGMRAAFENPRKFTLNSVAIERATKQSLRARIYIRSKGVERSLKAEIYGGGRDRAIEKILQPVMPSGYFAVPGIEAKRGSDGKVSIAWLNQVMSKLGYTGNVSATAKRRRRVQTNGKFFLLPERRGRLPPGIYQRDGRQVRPLIIFTRQPQYGAKFDWFGIARQSIEAHFAEEFRRAAETAMKSAR